MSTNEGVKDWQHISPPEVEHHIPSTSSHSPNTNQEHSGDAIHANQSPPSSTPNSQNTLSQLLPCASCNSYHYITQCIYTLPWTEWLAYHTKHMSSQPYPLPREVHSIDNIPVHNLWERARELDERATTYRPNFLANTRLKADLMTRSSVAMYWDDERWERSREKKEGRNMDKGLAKQVGNKAILGDGGDSGSEDELAAFESLRADFGRHLAGTSTATLFRPDGFVR